MHVLVFTGAVTYLSPSFFYWQAIDSVAIYRWLPQHLQSLPLPFSSWCSRQCLARVQAWGCFLIVARPISLDLCPWECRRRSTQVSRHPVSLSSHRDLWTCELIVNDGSRWDLKRRGRGWNSESVLKTPLYILLPIREWARHQTTEDEVKALWVGPRLFQIIDLEFDIRWHAKREVSLEHSGEVLRRVRTMLVELGWHRLRRPGKDSACAEPQFWAKP